MRHVLALVFGVAILVAFGCSSENVSLVQNPGDRSCQTADQCDADKVCVEFVCVPASQTIGPEEVAVEVLPPARSPYMRLHRLDVSLVNLARTLMLRLPEPIPYEAVVLNAEGEQIAGRLSIYGAERIPGRELEHRVDVLRTESATFPLVEGTYSAQVRPSDPALAPVEVAGFSVRPGAVLPKEFRLPSRYRRLHGRVTIAQAGNETIAGVTVRAVGEKSRLESTTGVSDDNGNYELLLPDTTDTVFQVTGTLASEEQPAWGFSQSILVELDADRQLDVAIERSSEDNRGTVVLSIVGIDDDGAGAAVPSALVTLTASVADRLAPPYFQRSGLTDSRGSVGTIPLLRARYVVQVVPPPTSPFAALTTVLDLRGAGQNFTLDRQLQLVRRTRVTGDVASAQSRGVAATIELEPLDADARLRSTQTDAEGRFAIDLDPGRYLMVVRPVDPMGGIELLPVGFQTITIPTTATHALPVVRLPAGNALSGVVRGALDNELIEGARIEMFVRASGRTISLGNDFTDERGAFRVVLPIPQ